MTGRISAKGNMYYMILNYKDERGKYKQKWIRTGLSIKIKGNQERAEGMLYEKLNEYTHVSQLDGEDTNIQTVVEQWLRIKKMTVEKSTYESYKVIVDAHINLFFKEVQSLMYEIQTKDLQNYFLEKLDTGLNPNTLIKHSTILNGCFKFALKQNYIFDNPMQRVVLPTKKEVPTDFFTADEMITILDKIRDTPIEAAVYIAVYTGFRRGEVLGVRWKRAIDWKQDTITMNHTVVPCGSSVIYKDHGKTRSSIRTISIPAPLRVYLLQLYVKQKNHRLTYGKEYQMNDYVCKWTDGRLLRPDYVTGYFKKFLETEGLPPYHFHTLRHSAATFLLSQGHSLLEIMLQLGHKRQESSVRYTHLQSSALINMAKSYDKLTF